MEEDEQRVHVSCCKSADKAKHMALNPAEKFADCADCNAVKTF
jgi:hypothetical protein